MSERDPYPTLHISFRCLRAEVTEAEQQPVTAQERQRADVRLAGELMARPITLVTGRSASDGC